ncbi:L-ribulose-5-phosphate 3-epimerase [Spiroplasma sp. DGKH1]|uniref:L-ribulose-5-phosphate 3-epimerase n=1 Tax=Spiroplasma sp. DGKH1 TaxID=3050074 RepID=UPI0034C6C75B
MFNISNQVGIYEKALPNGDWSEKFKIAKQFNFDFIELSIDESPERLARLDWSDQEINNLNKLQSEYQIKIRSICFSGHRKYPLGSHNETIRTTALALLKKCIVLAIKLGVRVIQLAGYDVYYEIKDYETRTWFLTNLKAGLKLANRYGVMLAIETMDDPFISSITKYLAIKKECPSPWLSVYPDVGNLSAWVGAEVTKEIASGIDEIVGFHLKDTIAVSSHYPGKFKRVPFGSGCVDFVKILQYLRTVDYQGSFMIEAWFEDDNNPVQELQTAVNFINKQFRKAGWG